MKSRLLVRFKGQHILLAVLTLALVGLGSPHPIYAAGTFISAPSRRDIVHDPVRNILYITSGSEVLRYNLTTQQFLSPYQLGGNLMGIDLSPDNNTLAVADGTYSTTQAWIYLVDLETSTSKKVIFPLSAYDQTWGTFSVAFGSDGNVLITENDQWSPLRKYNPTTGALTTLLDFVSGATMLSASADGNVIGFAEGGTTTGTWGRYRVSDGNIVVRSPGTYGFNFEIATNRNGTQFTIPIYAATYVFDSNLTQIATLWQSPAGSPNPIGAVYHPMKDILYLAWGGTQEVRAFETTNFTQVAAYNIEHTFQFQGNFVYQQGRLKTSRDGSYLFATVEGGVQYVQIGLGITITSPQAKDYAHNEIFNVTWNVTSPDSSVAAQSATLDGTLVTNGQLIDLFFLPLGSHIVRVTATDSAGHSANVSVTFNVVATIDSLIASEERTCVLSWISSKGVCDSLSAKLDQAKDANQRGQTNTAKRNLLDFFDQLNAQLGKAVNQQAYDLLKTDTWYVINHLQ